MAEAAQTPVIHDGPNESTLCKDVKLAGACLAPISQLLMGLREGAGHLNMLRPSHYVAQRSLVMAESGKQCCWNPYRLRWPCLRPGILESCYALEGPKVKIIGVHRWDDNRQGDL